jgi:hypothetical protein
MPVRGGFKRKNLKAQEKIKTGPKSNDLNKKDKDNTGPAQMVTVGGVDYITARHGESLCKDNELNKFNNQDVEIEGTFVGPILVISSIKKV